MTFEEARAEVGRDRENPPLEKIAGDVVLAQIASSKGFDWLYRTYGRTVRDRGIQEKRPYWYFLRGLLTTFDQSEQERFTALSGISIRDSVVPDRCKRKLMTNDAKQLALLHYDMACMRMDDKAIKMKQAWYILARANSNVSCSFWTSKMIDEEYTHELVGMATFAQMLENLETPGEGGLNYLVPDINPHRFFFSDDPRLRKEQVNKYGCIIDP
jgi:hypothetical protein